MESSSSSFHYFMESLEKGISLNINSMEGGLLKERNFKKGYLVILQKKNVSQSHWLLDSVTEIYPERIGIVRIVKLRTPANDIVRTANNFYLIDGSNN